MKAYSLDFRQKIIDVYNKETISHRHSPDFNPIENCWSKVKNILRSIGARTDKDLDAAITFAYSQVSLKDIRNWLAHSCYCISPF